jgi:3-hydroxyanthranilate 3,4-dioxygenase
MKLPFNLSAWIDEHRHLLKPPVGNKVIWKNEEFICMIVGGPNSRTDFHVDESPEFFYQLEGEMELLLHQNGRIDAVPIQAGEVFLLPPKLPHSPQRKANSIGLVIERKRRDGELDGLHWYCQHCYALLYQEYFQLHNIETQFGAVFDRFESDLAHRTCTACGAIHPLRKAA